MSQRAESLQQSAKTDAAPRVWIDVRHEANQTHALARDVNVGLRMRPKSIPPKHFYDAHGSLLFEKICDTSEYYPTRTEQSLLERNGQAIVTTTNPTCIVELGSGSARKVSTILGAVEQTGARCTYVPFDVSRSIVEASSSALVARFPWLSIHAIVGDFDKHLEALPRRGPTLFMFLGGTIGNFTPEEASAFLKQLAAHMQPEDHFLLGTDLVKDSDVLNRAYNDADGVTAAFNKNVLRVINHKLKGCFDLDSFEHIAYFDPDKAQIEMYLESLERQTVRIEGLEMDVEFAAGERILTEISRKFTKDGVRRMLKTAGLELTSWFEPLDGYFGLSLATRA